MIERLDPERVRSFAFRAGCASQVLWLALTDMLIYIASPHRDPLGYPDLVTHAIWLAPILALWIVRRSPSATILYALSLFAILVSRLDDCLRVVMYGHYAVPRLTGADLAATAIGGVSLAVIFFWLLDRLIDLVFIPEMAKGYSITLVVDPGIPGHATVEIKGPEDTTYAGLGPSFHGLPWWRGQYDIITLPNGTSPVGRLHDPRDEYSFVDSSQYPVKSYTFEISEEQALRAREEALSFRSKYPNYKCSQISLH